jgi:CRP-like cAMP-binding protein
MNTLQADLLKGLTEAQSAELLALGVRRQYPTGAELFPLGAPAHSVFLIERGRVALTLPMQVQGLEQDVMVEERDGGQVVGWSGLIPPHRFTLKATAQLQTDTIVLEREVLLAHFERHPEVGYLVTRNVASVTGQRLQIFQAMWLREMQRVIELRCP